MAPSSFQVATMNFHGRALLWDAGGGVRTSADGAVNQKHNRPDTSAVDCCGEFDLRVSTPKDGVMKSGRQARRWPSVVMCHGFHEPPRMIDVC